MHFLHAKNMRAGYSNIDILQDCSISVTHGELVVIVGSNGAGKSTAMKAIFGMLSLRSGTITLNGRDITSLQPHQRVDAGMSFVPQTDNIFPNMSVSENLDMGGYRRHDDITSTKQEIYDIFPILFEKRHQLAKELSGGQRQQVAVGRALMTQPSLLMLDEPTAGVSPIVMEELFYNIMKIKSLNIAILMVEQNAKQALTIADRGYVLQHGKNLYEAPAQDLLNDDTVRKSFLGG